MAVTVQGRVCHTTTYVQATGSPGDRQLQEAQAQEGATACCLEDQCGNLLTPPRALHHTRLRWDRLTQPPGCMCVCARRRVHVCGVRMKHCHLTSGYSEQGVLATLEHVNPPWKELTLRWRDREPDPDKNGCFSNKTRLQPEQRQAFKQKPSESWLSGSLSPPHSAGTEATPDLTLLSAPRRVKTLGGPQMSLACHRCGNEVPVC